MFKINCLNPIAGVGMELLTEDYEEVDCCTEACALLVRSASVHDLELPSGLEAIARAGAGVNNIPLDKCTESGVVVFNTPGANANGVKEIVVAALLMISRNLLEGINWVKSVKEDPELAQLVEKRKSKFVGTEITGMKLGVIGLGAIGVLVANAANKLEMEVFGYDPFISVDTAWKLSKYIKHSKSIDEIFRECDFITVHVPLTDQTKGMFNNETFAIMKDGVNILNYPNCDMGVCTHTGRIAINHRNIPNMLSQFTSAFAIEGINISEMTNKSKGQYSYAILDIDSPSTPEIAKKLREIDGVLKVRIIK